jgi:hypothetical protein
MHAESDWHVGGKKKNLLCAFKVFENAWANM